MEETRVLEVKKSILAANDAEADEFRSMLKEKETFFVDRTAALVVPVAGGAERYYSFESEITLETVVNETVHDIVRGHGTEERSKMLVAAAAVVVDVDSMQMITKLHKILILMTLAVSVTCIPAGVEQRMVYKITEVSHFPACEERVHAVHVGVGAVLGQNIYVELLHVRHKQSIIFAVVDKILLF